MRENGFRAIGGLAQRLTSGIAKGRGASIARLRAEWTAIVGPDLARITRPEALLSGRGARAGANAAGKALRLRVAGAAALEVQHKSGQLVERVNAYFGHKMIDDIRLVQGVIAARPAPKPTPAPRSGPPHPAPGAQKSRLVINVADGAGEAKVTFRKWARALDDECQAGIWGVCVTAAGRSDRPGESLETGG